MTDARIRKRVADEQAESLARKLGEIDREFLYRLSLHGKPARLPDLFDGCEPVWAIDSCERCEFAGYVLRDRDNRLSLTADGREQAMVGAVEHAEFAAGERAAGRTLNRR